MQKLCFLGLLWKVQRSEKCSGKTLSSAGDCCSCVLLGIVMKTISEENAKLFRESWCRTFHHVELDYVLNKIITNSQRIQQHCSFSHCYCFAHFPWRFVLCERIYLKWKHTRAPAARQTQSTESQEIAGNHLQMPVVGNRRKNLSMNDERAHVEDVRDGDEAEHIHTILSAHG